LHGCCPASAGSQSPFWMLLLHCNYRLTRCNAPLTIGDTLAELAQLFMERFATFEGQSCTHFLRQRMLENISTSGNAGCFVEKLLRCNGRQQPIEFSSGCRRARRMRLKGNSVR